jgi:flagellin-like hook-associated protein FlgL
MEVFMSFSINTNLGSLQAYNALAKVNAETTKAQLQLATQQKINSVADDTSGYNTGKRLQAQTMQQQSQLNNISDAQNYMATAESALSQINDKLNQIATKQVDAQDPLKDQASIASDIRTLAGEINSILKNTNINGIQLLASTDGSTALGSPTFDVGGNSFSADFASNAYLSVGTLASAVTSLTSNTASTVLGFDTSTVAANVRNSLGRLGNLEQTATSRKDYLTAAVTNNTATISNIFDADVVQQQINSAKDQIASQIATAMLSQMNSGPQNLLALFR